MKPVLDFDLIIHVLLKVNHREKINKIKVDLDGQIIFFMNLLISKIVVVL